MIYIVAQFLLLVPQEIRWIAARVDGRVERLLAKPGKHVKQDEIAIGDTPKYEC